MKTLYTTDYDFGFPFDQYASMMYQCEMDIADLEYSDPDDQILTKMNLHYAMRLKMRELVEEFAVESGTLFKINDQVVLALNEGWLFDGKIFAGAIDILETWMDV